MKLRENGENIAKDYIKNMIKSSMNSIWTAISPALPYIAIAFLIIIAIIIIVSVIAGTAEKNSYNNGFLGIRTN